MAIGIVGDAGVRANAQQPKLFVGMILILIFAEALALYGLIGKQQWNSMCAEIIYYLPIHFVKTIFADIFRLLCFYAVGIILASKAGTAQPM